MCSRKEVACCLAYKLIVVFFMAIFLVACGGGGGGGGGAQDNSVVVLTHFPANSETAVKLDSTIEISFSGSLDPATITESSVTLNETPSDRISYDESTNTLFLTPSQPLTSRTRYLVGINGIKDIDGNEISAYSWAFTTEDTEAPVVSSHLPAANSRSFANNNAIKIYFDEVIDADSVNSGTIYLDGGIDATVTPYTASATLTSNEPLIKGKTYTVIVSGVKDYVGNEMAEAYSWDFTVGWDEQTRVDPVERDGDASNAKVVMDENGNSFVTWNNDGAMMNHYVVGRGWEGVQKLNAGTRDIVMNAKGDMLFAWLYGTDIYVKGYSTESGWADSVKIATIVSGTSSMWLDLSMDEAGNAVAVWLNGSYTRVFGRAFTAEGGWQEEVALESFNIADSIAPKVESDELGNSIVVWRQGGNIWANRYGLGVGWSGEFLLEYDDIPKLSHDVSVNSSGQAVVAWSQPDEDIWVTWYAPDTGWDDNATNIRVHPYLDIGSSPIRAELDDSGRAIVVEGYSGQAFRYTPESGWDAPQDVNGALRASIHRTRKNWTCSSTHYLKKMH